MKSVMKEKDFSIFYSKINWKRREKAEISQHKITINENTNSFHFSICGLRIKGFQLLNFEMLRKY